MAWNPSPEVAVARDAARKLGVDQVMVVTIDYSKNQIGSITYGANKKLCAHAAQLGKAAYRAVFKAMEEGEFGSIEHADECDDSRYRLLAQEAVVALHMHRHAGLTEPGFEECRQGLCKDWHDLEEKRIKAEGHAAIYCCGCDMPRPQCVCDCT